MAVPEGDEPQESAFRKMSAPAVKAILGYDIADGVSIDDYESWLRNVHFPDLLANPYLDRLVTNTIVRPVTQTSAGTATTEEPTTFYRIVELHFTDHEAYERYLAWFVSNPIPEERSPAGRTEFRFYVLADSAVVDRDDSVSDDPPSAIDPRRAERRSRWSNHH